MLVCAALVHALSVIYFDTTPEEFQRELFTEREILFANLAGICQFFHEFRLCASGRASGTKAQIAFILRLFK